MSYELVNCALYDSHESTVDDVTWDDADAIVMETDCFCHALNNEMRTFSPVDDVDAPSLGPPGHSLRYDYLT